LLPVLLYMKNNCKYQYNLQSMGKKKLFILILIFYLIPVYSQDKSNFLLGFEFGSDLVIGNLNPKWNIRQEVGNYENSYDTPQDVCTQMTMGFIGIKPEITFLNNRVGLSSGLRYTRMNSLVDRNSYMKGSFFYLRSNGFSTITDYFKVKEIYEDNDYLGIPLEITGVPFENEYLDVYLKVGAELNFRFNTNIKIRFFNQEMNPYQQELIHQTGITSKSIFSSFYSGMGIRFGKKNKVKYNLEFVLPSYILSSTNSSLVVPEFYTGFKFIVQFPMCKKIGIKKENFKNDKLESSKIN